MRKRLLSALLALCMVLALLPTYAMASDPDQDVLTVTESEWDLVEDSEMPESGSEEAPEEGLAAPDTDPDLETNLPDDDIPEFVPGIIMVKDELVYPSYEKASLYPINGAALASKYDSRTTYQSSVKNQGSNGLCWAFGSYAALEANAIKNGLGELDFSEMHMAYSTSSNSGNGLQGWSRAPGDGGNRYYSSAYLLRGTTLSGTVNESDDPYSTSLIGDRDLSISQGKTKSYTAQNVLFLTEGAKANAAEVQVIKQAIVNYGGVGASIYWEGQTTATNGTTSVHYNSSTSSYYYNVKNNDFPENDPWVYDDGRLMKNVNHLIEIVGWDDNYAVTNFSTSCQPSSPGAWLIKNSWGTSWGDGGYAWVSYEDENFPCSAFCFDGIKTFDSTATVYETDYKFGGTGLGWSGASSAYFAKVYTANTANEHLDSVRVAMTNPTSKIEVDVITNFSSWTGYTFSAKGTATPDLQCPGWYTVDLNTPALLGTAGSKFAVVVKLTAGNNAKGIYIGYDNDNAISAAENYRNAETYFSLYGTSWSNDDTNFAIKAVTTSGPIAVTGVTLDQTSLTLAVGGTGTLTATVAPAYATNKGVIWSSSNTSVATVDANGKVTGVSKGTATITVTTADGGKTATCTVNVVELGLNKSTLSLLKGKNETLSIVGAASGMSFTWSSGNTGVAKVDANGKVTAVAPGVTTISLNLDGKAVSTCTVYVYEFSGLVFADGGKSTYTFSCMQGTADFAEKKFTLTAQQKTAVNTAGLKGLEAPTVTSSNTGVATASAAYSEADGAIVLTVKPVGVGNTSIKVTFGGKTATLTVKVEAKTPNKVTALTFAEGGKATLKGNGTVDEDKNLFTGGTYTLNVTKAIPEEAIDGQVTVTTSKAAVVPLENIEAKLEADGSTITLKVTPMAAGSSSIKVAYGGKTATLTYKVTAVPPNKVTGLTFAKSGKTSLSDPYAADGAFAEQTYVLNVAKSKPGEPLVAKSVLETLTVTSSKPAVVPQENVRAVLSADGSTITLKVTPVGTGSGSIKVKFGGKTATLTLKVTNKLQPGWFSIPSEVEYTGSAIKPVIDKSKAPADVKYSVKYANNKLVGDTATVTLKGSGSYGGEVILTFKIVPVDLSGDGATVTTPKSNVYNGKPNPAKVTVKAGKKTLKAGTDYELWYKVGGTETQDAPTDAGTYTLIIKGKGNYVNQATTTYEITKAPINKMSVSLSSSVTSNGAAVSPTTLNLKVKIGSVELDSSAYSVSYRDAEGNTISAPSAPGKYTIVVTATSGNFTGTAKDPNVLYVTKTFTIK